MRMVIFEILLPQFCMVFMCTMLLCMVDVILFQGWTPLTCASYHGLLPIVKYLLEQKANIKANDKKGMFLNCDTAVLSGWYVCGCRVYLWILICAIDVMTLGLTPLMHASCEGYQPVVKHLIEQKANMDAKNNDGNEIFRSL